jgi:hypothetical protein
MGGDTRMPKITTATRLKIALEEAVTLGVAYHAEEEAKFLVKEADWKKVSAPRAKERKRHWEEMSVLAEAIKAMRKAQERVR